MSLDPEMVNECARNALAQFINTVCEGAGGEARIEAIVIFSVPELGTGCISSSHDTLFTIWMLTQCTDAVLIPRMYETAQLERAYREDMEGDD